MPENALRVPSRRFGRMAALVTLLWACATMPLVLPANASAAGRWTATGPLAVGRGHHTATLLPSGKVLVAGGRVTDFTSTTSAELYDPSASGWVPAGSLGTARSFHTAALLTTGRVLVTGGLGTDKPTDTAELFDPVTAGGGAWSPAPKMAAARSRHTATRLADGRVLVVGGFDMGGAPLASVEIFDPAAGGGAGAWSAAPSLAEPRARHTATLLADGRVLVVAGTICSPPSPPSVACPTNSAEIFDPAANGGAGGWSAAAPVGGARFDHLATRLANGRVLIAGGQDGVGFIRSSSELFDPAVNPGPLTWTDATPMSAGRTDFASALLADGRVLVAGGGTGNTVNVGSADVWDPAAGAWRATGSLITARRGHTLTALSSTGCAPRCGRVLLAGGIRRLPSDHLLSAELYDPAAVPSRPTVAVYPTPGAVTDLVARARSVSRIVLTFSAPGRPPARSYVVKQATTRIVGESGFARARSLCGGMCGFGPRTTGERLTLTVRGLRPKRTYYYALRALDASGRPGPVSNVARARTRSRRPGRVRGLRARALSATRIRLSFKATGAPPARRYLIKQSRVAITSTRRFRLGRSLCRGTCHFTPREEDDRIRLLVTGLRPSTRYCYAARARVGRRVARRSKGACARTKPPRRLP